MNDKYKRIDVEAVANLARLTFTAEEMEAMAQDMSAIVAFADKLSALDTENVPVTAHVVPLSNVFREDAPGAPTDRDELLANAPTKADGFFTVPRVVES